MAPGEGGARFLRVTPAGCYHAVESAGGTPERELLLALLRRPSTPPAESAFGGEEGSAEARIDADSLATRLVDAGFAERVAAAESLPGGTLSECLPSVLGELSGAGGAVLVETRQGLLVEHAGVGREEAEELAALAADLLSLSERRAASLLERLGLPGGALGIIDPSGCSEVGFWPLHVGENVFTLTILGIPLLNNPAFRTLVWMLVERYGRNIEPVGVP